jgi:hydroxypyruvate isomerase
MVESMQWTLRYASHLGYRSADRPLFRESVGSLDLDAHVRFAAELGLAGVQDLWVAARPIEEQRALGRAIERYGLEGGCVVNGAREKIRAPLWAVSGPEARSNLAPDLAAAIEAAGRIRARCIVVLSGALPNVPAALQFAAMVENLRWAADIAGKAGITLCLESMSYKSHPHMLLHHLGETYAAAKAVNHPALKLIFDTSHVQIMDGDLLANLDAVWDEIALVQIVDNPGRLEPGTGEINFANILRALKARGYTGLVELEHGWSEPTRACEQRGIENLQRMDAQLQGEA